MTRIIAVASQKGGVGKTTTTYTLGSILAQRERSVLLIDLDPQASLTTSCGIIAEAGGMGEVLEGGLALTDVIVPLRPGLHLAPASIELAYTEMALSSKPVGRERRLGRVLANISKYDYILIDCPPSLGLLTINGLVAAKELLIPARPEYLGMRALEVLYRTLDDVREVNPDLVVIGILPTQVRRTRHHAEAIAAWAESGLPVLPVNIGESIIAAEAVKRATALNDYAPSSPIAASYNHLAEIIDQ
jgi:chromosome partitioning protein